MADQLLLDFLLSTLGKSEGRREWIDYKLRAGGVDLASADFTDKNFRDYDFSEANLSTSVLVRATLARVDFSDADLSYADLRCSDLRGGCLDRADLRSANLQGANLADACMEGVNLAGARLEGADLIGADLSMADLTGADLRGTCLKYARLTGARLEGADVAGADLSGSVMDDDAPAMLENFDLAVIDDRQYRIMKSHLSETNLQESMDGASKSKKKKSRSGRRKGKAKPKTLIQLVSPLEGDPGKKSGSKLETDSNKKSRKRKTQSKSKGRAGARTQSVVEPPEAESERLEGVAELTDLAGAKGLATEEGCYRILGIEQGAPLAGITKAFRTKAKLYHPDRVRHLSAEEQEASREQFQVVRQAYEKLTRMKPKPMTHIHWAPGVPKRASPYEYTVEEYLKLAKANPASGAVLYNLAWKYFDEGMMDESIESYERVLGLDPNDEDAQYNLRVVKLCKTFDFLPEIALDAS